MFGNLLHHDFALTLEGCTFFKQRLFRIQCGNNFTGVPVDSGDWWPFNSICALSSATYLNVETLNRLRLYRAFENSKPLCQYKLADRKSALNSTAVFVQHRR